jgi:hypothetical protein
MLDLAMLIYFLWLLQGNLCMEAAMEVTLASKSVHATVFDPQGKVVDRE